MKTINHYKTGSAADIIEIMRTGYANMIFCDKAKRYEFMLREIPEIGPRLTFGDYGPMTEEQELTYAEQLHARQKFDIKNQRAYLEPITNGDDDEVQK